MDPTPASVVCVRDSIPPVTTVSVSTAAKWVPALNASAVVGSSVSLSLGANEPTRGFYVIVDGVNVNGTGSFVDAPVLLNTSSLTLSNLTAGEAHRVVVQGVDLTGAA